MVGGLSPPELFSFILYLTKQTFVQIGFGFPQTWTALLGLRLLLGVLEAGFFPGEYSIRPKSVRLPY